jgi:hypothetical protein
VAGQYIGSRVGEGEGEMNADKDFSEIEERAARLMREALELPHGPERDVFPEEIEHFIARLSALKAKGQ